MASCLLLLLLVLIIGETFIPCFALDLTLGLQREQNQRLVYSRSVLLSLRNRHYAAPDHLPAAIRVPHTGTQLRRKRGRRGGFRERLRRRSSKSPLPSVILSNVRSLAPKIDELCAITKTCFKYRESNLMVLTESWLHEGIPDSLLELDGYTLVHADRSSDSGKKSGGGVCMNICDRWCKQYTVRDKVCTPDIELLCVSLRPHYLPREFACVIICAVYIPPSGNAGKAAACIAECAHEQLQRSPRAPIFFLGDFNNCKLETVLAGFEQYVRCDTRKTKILDKCYGNVKNAYAAKSKPPLSNSDHNVVHLIPSYKSVFQCLNQSTKWLMYGQRILWKHFYGLFFVHRLVHISPVRA